MAMFDFQDPARRLKWGAKIGRGFGPGSGRGFARGFRPKFVPKIGDGTGPASRWLSEQTVRREIRRISRRELRRDKRQKNIDAMRDAIAENLSDMSQGATRQADKFRDRADDFRDGADRLRERAEHLRAHADMLAKKQPHDASRPAPELFAAELGGLAEPLARHLRPPLKINTADNPRVIILLPGFGTHPSRMRYMAQQLERAGHTVKSWGAGFNMGPTEESFEMVLRRVEQVHARYGEKVVLVGWSLGGLFAREVAKVYPQGVAKVITMGTPFSHSPYSNNVWKIYQLITGHSVEKPPIGADLKAKPPVETVAMWSPRDGLIHPRSARGLPGERDRVVALRCTHMGFSNAPEVILALAKEL